MGEREFGDFFIQTSELLFLSFNSKLKVLRL